MNDPCARRELQQAIRASLGREFQQSIYLRIEAVVRATSCLAGRYVIIFQLVGFIEVIWSDLNHLKGAHLYLNPFEHGENLQARDPTKKRCPGFMEDDEEADEQEEGDADEDDEDDEEADEQKAHEQEVDEAEEAEEEEEEDAKSERSEDW